MLKSLLDGRVFAERTGATEANVLALHGWGRTRADLLEAVAGTAALVPDLPGFGASPPPPQAWGTRDFAELLAPLLDDGEPWTVLGHSFGGRVAVQLAALRPDRVSGVVLTGVPLFKSAASGRSPLGYRAARALHRRGLLSDDRMERLKQTNGSADYRAATGVVRDTLVRTVNEDYAELLPLIGCRVELVWGRHDTAAPVDVAERALTLLPNGRLSVSDSSAHLLDEALTALVQQRLRSLNARPADHEATP